MHQLQVFTKRICQSILDTVTYIHDMYFSYICHFRPMTRPNPLKTQIFDPFPTRPDPTQPTGQPNPWTTLTYLVPHNAGVHQWRRRGLQPVSSFSLPFLLSLSLIPSLPMSRRRTTGQRPILNCNISMATNGN